MLSRLSIKNYILIHELELELPNGFSAITGETGAGKSILIGALSLILGKRADTDVLLSKDSKCVIEGTFHTEGQDLNSFFSANDLDFEESLVMRREISITGKSRAFINDTPVNLSVMRELGEKLVDIHSQHETLLLNESGFQLALLDNYAECHDLLNKYKSEHKIFISRETELRELLEKEHSIRSDEEYTRFRFDEIVEADLQEGMLESLEKEQEILSNAEEIKSSLYEAVQSLDLSENSLIERLSGIVSITSRVSSYHDEINELNKRLNSANIELKDISSELEKLEENINFDPGRLEEVNDKLDLIFKLQQKHNVSTISELFKIRDELNEKLSRIESLDEDIKTLTLKRDAAREELKRTSSSLRDKRSHAIPAMEKELTAILHNLGMEEARIKISLTSLESFSSKGQDSVVFEFSANHGSQAAAISKIASGGELSRLMLGLKSLITRKSLLPTIILDEIDMGVSGEIAGKVGNMLKEMSGNMQLIAITHLPQIAGKAQAHFKVYKKIENDRTVSAVERLSDEERIDEIAGMLSNENVSISAKETAKELLGMQIEE